MTLEKRPGCLFNLSLGPEIGMALFVMLLSRWIFNFNGLYGQDAHEYLRYANALREYIRYGAEPGGYFWSPTYPALGAALSMFIFKTAFSLQLLSVLAWGGTAMLLRRALVHMYPAEAIPAISFVGFAVLLSPAMVKGGLVVMSDMTATFACMGALYHTYLFKKEGVAKNAIWAGVFAGYAVWTRYATVLLLLPCALYMAWALVQQVRRNSSLWWVPLAGIAALLPFGWLFSWSKGGDMTSFLGHEWLVNWSANNFFLRDFQLTDGEMHYALPNIAYAFFPLGHPEFMVFGLLMAPFIRLGDFKPTVVMVAAAGALLYCLFLAGIPYQNRRFLLPAFPFWALALFPAYCRFRAAASNGGGLVVLIIFLAQIYLCFHFLGPVRAMNRQERHFAETVQYFPPTRLYTFGPEGALETYECPHKIISMYQDSIPTPVPGDLLIFSESAYTQQWAGKNPMKHWSNFKNNYNLTPLRTFENGWAVWKF